MRTDKIPPFAVALATFLVFSGTLRNGFLNWDDTINFLQNPYYRGLGWTQLRWMFTSSFDYCHYIPLTWLTFGLDFALWGMNPFGYHLTSLLLHCANASVFYFVSRRLLVLAAPKGEERSRIRLDLTAALSALLFALHPLRVESVAWITERRDVLSGFFYLLTTLCYLKAGGCADKSKALRWLALSVLLFACALLSKIGGITLPLAFLVIDVYPSGRLPWNPGRWFSRETRRVWLEKIPFILLALPAGFLGIVGQGGAAVPLERWGASERLAVALYGASFYVWKTIAPWGLSPLYPLPSKINPWAAPFLASGLFVAAMSVFAVAARRRQPAVLAVWSCYLVTLLPVSGLVQIGDQIAADRYTYIPCFGFALFAAGAAARLWAANGPRARIAIAVLSGFFLVTLGCLTGLQVRAWRDTESLWRQASLDPDNALAHYNLGDILHGQGKLDEAILHFKQAVQAKPGFDEAYNNLGVALTAKGDVGAAIETYDRAIVVNPNNAGAHNNLGCILAGQGKTTEAIRHYDLAIKAKPEYAEAHNNLGLALSEQGKLDAAIPQFALAIRENPSYPEAHDALGNVFARQGKFDEAIRQYRLALTTNPNDPEAHSNLGLVLAGRGRLDDAIHQYDLALSANPNYAIAHYNMGLALTGKGALDAAIAQYRRCLAIDPGFAPARGNLEILLKRKTL